MGHMIILLAENELAAVEFKTPISSTKGREGKNLICIFIVCIEKQTKGSQDEAVKNIEKYALLSQSYFLVNHGLN